MNKVYKSSDFYLSAYLLTEGCPLTGHSRLNQTTMFEFEDTEFLQKLVAQYYSMAAHIEPMAFGATIRNLKSVIHSANSNSKGNSNNGNTIKRS